MRFRSLTTKSLAAGLALAVGVPAVALAAHPFEDVPDGEWYSEAVDWAYNVGLTTGKTPTTFNGWDNTNRYEMVTMFDRFNDSIVAPLAAAIDELEEDVAALKAAEDDAVAVHFELFDSDSSPTPVIHSSTTGLIPEMQATVTVPEGYEGVIEAELAAESACYGGSGHCFIDILVDGSTIATHSENQVFDSSDFGNEGSSSWESHTIRAVSAELDPGTYDVTFAMATSNNATTFFLDDMLLTAEVHLTAVDTLDFVIAGE